MMSLYASVTKCGSVRTTFVRTMPGCTTSASMVPSPPPPLSSRCLSSRVKRMLASLLWAYAAWM
eukprot:239321-Chlamydomonas_euryale.AAC.1